MAGMIKDLKLGELVGCAGGSELADLEVQAICDSVKSEVEKKTGKKYTTFKAKTYWKKVVAGTNYIVKVDVGGKKTLEICVFQGLPHTNSKPSLQSVKECM